MATMDGSRMVMDNNPADYGTLDGYTCTNIFLKEYAGQCGFFADGRTAVAEWVGWLVVVGFSLFFSVGVAIFVWFDNRFGEGDTSSEQFNTAGRSVKMGLIACVTVSQWTWAATLLQSSNVGWGFGVSGPFWYAAGATIQVILFAVLAVQLKRRAPKAHTVLEVVRCRWGTKAHIVFGFFCFATNLIVTSMLILGGASVVNALSGVNIYAAAMLIPLGVVTYTAFGGLKGTFIAAWSHTAMLYIVMLLFMFWVYVGGTDYLGSFDSVYYGLKDVETVKPVENNMGGSYMTFFSQQGLIFGVINVVGNFGTVFVDQSYWQSAIAAKPDATYWGYVLGGLCWFAIPFGMATTFGLGARALDLPLTKSESGSGLTPPAIAVQLKGSSGGFLVLFQLFMAVSSTGAAEQVAVASLVAYDIYRTYINPKATGKQIKHLSQFVILLYAIISGVSAIVLLKIGLSLGWVYLFMGIVVGAAVAPIAMCIMWDKLSGGGAILASCSGLVGAVFTWLLVAGLESGELTVDSLGKDYPMLSGNVVAICLSLIVCTISGFVKPQNFDWNEFDKITMIEKNHHSGTLTAEERAGLDKAIKWVSILCVVMTVVLLIVWPLLALIPGVWSKGYFTFYVILAFIWAFAAGAYTTFGPIIESWTGIMTVIKNVITCNRVKQYVASDEPDPSVKPVAKEEADASFKGASAVDEATTV